MKYEDLVKAQILMEFVNTMIGAFESGFVDTPIFNLAQLYQVARNTCKDECSVEVEPIDKAWGLEFAIECGFVVNPPLEPRQ